MSKSSMSVAEFERMLDPYAFAEDRLNVFDRPVNIAPGEQVSFEIPDLYPPLDGTFRKGLVIQNKALSNYFLDRRTSATAGKNTLYLTSLLFAISLELPDDGVLHVSDFEEVNHQDLQPFRPRSQLHVISFRGERSSFFSIANLVDPNQPEDLRVFTIGKALLKDHLPLTRKSLIKVSRHAAAN